MNRTSVIAKGILDLSSLREIFGSWSRASFHRRFPDLRPFDPPGRSEVDKVEWLNDLASTMVFAGQDLKKSEENPRIPAGYTYFGQFLAHDLVMTARGPDHAGVDGSESINVRDRGLGLEALYGGGPEVAPSLYERNGSGRFLVGGREDPLLRQALEERPRPLRFPRRPADVDLARNHQGVALIADPRNDFTTMIAQMQLCLMLVHNKLVTRHRGRKDPFASARQSLTWHYQWVIVFDYLRRILDEDRWRILDDAVQGLRKTTRAMRLSRTGARRTLPVELVAAAFRFGHSMVRPSYALNDRIRDRVALVPASTAVPPTEHLLGLRWLPEDWTIDWRYFLDVQGRTQDPRMQSSKRIEPRVTMRLASLPREMLPPGVNLSLPLITLMRGWMWGLPSGQDVAQALGFPPSGRDPEPLWVYVLREAKEAHRGERLGPVCSSLVLESFWQVLVTDPSSFLVQDPSWQPEIESGGKPFRLLDLLDHADLEAPKRN